MRLLVLAGLFSALACLAQAQVITIPAGTKVALALTSPVWAKSVQLGDSIYAETAFPVTVANAMAIPPGTYVKGQIDIMALRSGHAEFRIQFTQMVFADGSAVGLTDNALATLNVVVGPGSDVLLDNGTQFEMVCQHPLTLEAAKVAAAVRLSKPAKPAPWKSATRCRPTPATPGTSDTVIPGTPSTPDTVIPGGPGMPDTVIPGSPGTPSTVISGTPGTPEMPCPGPPAVVSQPAAHKESFTVNGLVKVAGQLLPPGTYEATWEGLGPVAEVQILRKSKLVATVQAQVVALGKKAPETEYAPVTNPDGSLWLESLQFKGQTFGLRLGQ